MKNQKRLAGILFMAGFSVLLLTACGKPDEAPEMVLQKFKAGIAEVKSGQLTLSADMTGVDNKDNVEAKAQLAVAFDWRGEKDRKISIDTSLNGKMTAGETVTDGALDLSLRSVGDNFYIYLKKLESSDPTFKSAEPIIKGYSGKWLKLASDFVPKNIREVQTKDAAALEKENQIRKLFAETALFTVAKEYGKETVNGKKVYHYGIRLDKEGVKDYLRKTALIEGTQITDTQLDDAAKAVDSLQGLEVWIGVKDYYLYKATGHLNAQNEEENGVKAGAQLTLEGAGYNEDQTIETPENAEEFNPLALLMGAAQIAPAPATPSAATPAPLETPAVPAPSTTTP